MADPNIVRLSDRDKKDFEPVFGEKPDRLFLMVNRKAGKEMHFDIELWVNPQALPDELREQVWDWAKAQANEGDVVEWMRRS